MQDIIHSIWTGLTTASRLDQLNLVLGVLGVALMIRRTLWAFPVGLLAVSVQGVLFYRARFYADATLQIFYFVVLAWGWRHWVRDRGAAPELPVSTLSWRARALLSGVAVIATVGWALVLQAWTDAIMPWRDALIAVLMVVAQVLQARKNIENWPLWIVANGIAIAAYWSAALAYSAFLYAVYLVLAVVGWRAWRRAMQAGQLSAEALPEGMGRGVGQSAPSSGPIR